MTKFNEIKDGYTNLLKKNQQIEEIALNRLSVCGTCPSNSKNKNMVGSLIPYCTECGCILEAKARSIESECPLKKW